MKKLLSLLLLGAFLAACQQECELDPLMESEGMVVNEGLSLEQKLLNMRDKGTRILSRTSYANKTNLRLREYDYVGDIETVQQLEELKRDILSDNSYIPYYDLDNKKIVPLTWNEIKESKQYDCIQYSKDNLSEYLDRHLEQGMGILMLTWEFGSKQCNSICVFSGDSIIYDNIILNMLCFEEKEPSTNIVYSVKSRSETTSFNNLTAEFGGDAYWLWGSHRGEVRIRHSIYGSYNYLQNSDCNAFARMTLGDADAKANIANRVLGQNGYSICAYGYYIASVAISAKIIQHYSPISYSVEVSGFGEKVVGSGEHSLHSQQIQSN